jgi:hypothetical protein
VRGVTDALLTELGLDRVGVCLLSIPETTDRTGLSFEGDFAGVTGHDLTFDLVGPSINLTWRSAPRRVKPSDLT